jgi:hypothetical protein
MKVKRLRIAAPSSKQALTVLREHNQGKYAALLLASKEPIARLEQI